MRAGVAEPRRPLRLARVLVLADRDEAPVALDQAAVAGRVGGREAQRDQRPRRPRAPSRSAFSVAGANERDVRIGDEDVVVAARDRSPRRQNGVRRPPPLALDERLPPAAPPDGRPRPRRPGQARRPQRYRRRRPPERPRARARSSDARRRHAGPLDGRSACGRPRRRRERSSGSGGRRRLMQGSLRSLAATSAARASHSSVFQLRQNASRGAAK